jgi:hypothetical protein
VLTLDADYVLPADFSAELTDLKTTDDMSAGYARFRYFIFGRPLHATLYPPRAVLFRKDRCHYVQDGHTQHLQIQGGTFLLRNIIDHDDRKSLAHWLRSQDQYAALEVTKLTETPQDQLSFQDRLRRRLIIAPFLMFFYTLLVKRLILDGWPGWFYVFQRTLAEIILSLRLIEEKMKTKADVQTKGNVESRN